MPKVATKQSLAGIAPLSLPGTRHPSDKGAVRDPVEDTKNSALARINDGLYSLLERGIDLWGGQEALARLWGCSLTNVNNRVNRVEEKLARSYAFLDFLSVALTHPAAAESTLNGLCELLGYEHPKKRRTKTEHEKFEALVKSLRGAGELGQAAIAKAARDLGADLSEYDL